MLEQPRWQLWSLPPLLAGLAWLWLGAKAGFDGFLASLLPGTLLLASGAAKLLWPGDPRIQQFGALGGALGVLLGLPGLYFLGLAGGLVLIVLSAAGFAAAGAVSIRQASHLDDVPRPVPSLGLAAQVALDEALLATMQLSLPMPRGDDFARIRREVQQARELYSERGWLEKPASYHVAPPPLEAPRIASRSVRLRGGSVVYEHLRFESGYEPHPGEPGRDRWLSHGKNRIAHAWVLRHRDGEPRPWLVCINGYQMGWPLVDFGAFDPRRFHRQLGLDMLCAVLPLHGPRKSGRRSGDGFLAGDALDTIHAEAQAMWDIRRLIGWARAQGATAVGAYGISLGGYNVALLAGLADDLACAIPGVPVADFARLLWRHGPPLQVRYMEHQGLVHDEVAEVSSVVSPLALEPRLPRERLAIFAGVGDRLVPPDQVRDLWRHWGRPAIAWYQGAHVTFMLDPQVRRLVDTTLRDALLA